MKAERGTFGERLRLARERAGLSTAELARRAGMPAMSLYQLEWGRRRPLLETAAALARALGVSLDSLA